MVLAIIIGALAGALSAFAFSNFMSGKNELIKDFYETENAVYISPHSLRGKMDKSMNGIQHW